MAGARIDPTLSQAAGRHAAAILDDPARATRRDVERAVEREGLADALILPFSAIGTDKSAHEVALVEFAKTTARGRAPTHVGVARRQKEGRVALVALFSRRLVELAPLPQRLPPRAFTFRGRRRPKQALEALLMGPCEDGWCAGGVRNVDVRTKGTLFEATIEPRGPGWYVAEIMVDDGRGPEAAALWRFRVGPPIEPADKQGARPGALFEQIVRDRRRADLGPLVKNVALEKAALEHANNVCRAGLAAHVLPGGADPSARARRAKYGGVVAENVAIADNVQTAHHDFMWSPSHRRNVLDPLITEVGLGVVRRREKTGLAPSVCVVELFGQGR